MAAVNATAASRPPPSLFDEAWGGVHGVGCVCVLAFACVEWHLGARQWPNLPINRGFDHHFGMSEGSTAGALCRARTTRYGCESDCDAVQAF